MTSSIGRVASQTATSAAVAYVSGADPRQAALVSLGFSLLQYGNSAMRDATVESSNRSGLAMWDLEDGMLRVANNTGIAGTLSGFFGIKYAGSRNIFDICGHEAGCEFNEDGSALFLGSSDLLRRALDRIGEKSYAGGVQGWGGMAFGSPYHPSGLVSRVMEAFAPSHDYFNAPYWYDQWGNTINHSGFARQFGEALSAFNLLPAMPFALSTFIPVGTPDIVGGRKRD